MPFYLNSQPLPRLHGLQSAQITIASLAPNMPQWDSICPHPPSPTGLLLTGNLALCSMLAPSIARADGGALGAGGCRILKFPIKSAWFLYPLHTKNSRISFQEIIYQGGRETVKSQKWKHISPLLTTTWVVYKSNINFCMHTPFSPLSIFTPYSHPGGEISWNLKCISCSPFLSPSKENPIL